jgi:hypothetical protein
MALSQIYGHKRDEIGEWIRLHNEELHSLYHSVNIVKGIKSGRLRWDAQVARIEEDRSALIILKSKPIGKRCLGRPGYRRENIRMDLKEIGVNMRKWINLAHDKDYWRA